MNNTKKMILPSLSISITDICNLNCIYCPPYGENLIRCDNMCKLESIIELVNLISEYKLPVIRITVGEPLLFPERVIEILRMGKKLSTTKFILNTNGTKVLENIDLLEDFKDIFLMKISLDTTNENIFDDMTRTNKQYPIVLKGLEQCIQRGFRIEINSVLTQKNIGEILDVIEYADNNGIDIKLFGVNNFEGKVNSEILYTPIDQLIVSLDNKYIKCEKEGLPGDRGIQMLKYKTKNDNRILIVDHNKKSRFNKGKKTYSKFCKTCRYYPCASGMFSVTLRSDGLLQTCRMRPEKGINISGLNTTEIKDIISTILEPYSECYIKEED